jgi:cyclin-dependent kinase 12/13
MKFTLPQIKCYMSQLLKGLHYCHRNNILHRDIKGSNLLINNNGILKLADFGLARSYTNENAHPLTNRVITLWYRPPELLLGTTTYGPSIDMWSAGCIFAELLYGKPILPGKNEFEQLELIFRLCGTPTPENWPEAEKLPMAKAFKQKEKYPRRVRDVFNRFSPSAKDLVERFLTLDPSKRITAVEALDSDWFWENPMACDPGDLPRYEPSHEFQTKKRRQEAKRQAVEQQNKRQRTDEQRDPPRPPPPEAKQGWDRNRHPPGAPPAPQSGPPMASRYGSGPSTAAAGWSGGQQSRGGYAGQQGRGGYGSVGGGLNSLGSRGGSYSNLNIKAGTEVRGSYAGYRGGGQTAGWASGGRGGGGPSGGSAGASRGGWTGGSNPKPEQNKKE